jgi:acetyl-CoA acetyltransferase
MTNSVAVAGVGLHPFGRFDRTVTQMGVSAVRAALEDAGNPSFQSVFCATVYSGVAAGHKVLGALGLTGTPIVNVEAGCASGGAALMLATNAVRSGQCDTALVLGIEKMPRGIIRSSFFEPWREQSGLAATPAYFALRAMRLMRDSGITKEDLAQIVVKNRAEGVNNEIAMYRTATTVEAVLESRLVCEPLHLHMLCSPNEGAAAIVVQRSDLARRDAPKIASAQLRSHLPGSILGEATPLSGVADENIPAASTIAAHAAFEEAGYGPDDLDLIECQDTDAAREILAYEELGLCARGDSAQLLRNGDTARGGRWPVNLSGGLLSKGEPLGASALAQIIELSNQIDGRAGVRQIENAQVGLAHTVGRGANAAVVIITK